MFLPGDSVPQSVLSRRSFLGTAGASSAALLAATSHGSTAVSPRRAPRQAVIVWLEGGLSHVDSWDPKPFTRGRQFAPIETSVPGIWISELFPCLARQMHHLTAIRSYVAAADDHASAVLPLEMSIADAVKNWKIPESTAGQPFSRIVLNGGRSSRPEMAPPAAARLLADQPLSTWNQYGDNEFGQATRLAGLLLGSGSRLVEIRRGGFDTHTHNEQTLRAQAAVIDPSLAALISDLADRGTLAETALLVLTDFGRTPRLNSDGGRDHWSAAGSFLASRSVWGSTAPAFIGCTNDTGSEILADPVHTEALAHHLTEA